MSLQGSVEAIFLIPGEGLAPQRVVSALAHAGRGLEGDRHFDEPDACDLSLIEAEAIDAFKAESGIDLTGGESRRQVIVRGVDLGDFIGKRFRVGEVECEGEERCEPCNHLAGMLQTQVVLKGLLHTGLRARVLRGGTLRAGDSVELVDLAALVEGSR